MRTLVDTLQSGGRTSRRRFVLGTGAGLALGFVLPRTSSAPASIAMRSGCNP